ncbi:MAG: restriction endonuclease [Thermacetogeniaceae bacterium]
MTGTNLFAGIDYFVLIKTLFITTWPIWLLIAVTALGKLAFRLWEKNRLAKSGIADIDQMSGKTFEKYLEVLFEKLGYRVERTRYVGDYGADLVTTAKNGVKTVIQAKRYKGKAGVKAIQEAVAAKGYYDCTKAMVVTNSFFTQQAMELARRNQVELWDRNKLVAALLSVKEKTPVTVSPDIAGQTQAAASTDDRHLQDIPQNTCAVCGKPVLEKVMQYCLAHQERFGGKIYCYEHQRSASI